MISLLLRRIEQEQKFGLELVLQSRGVGGAEGGEILVLGASCRVVLRKEESVPRTTKRRG
jgi:hypothetical protein